MILKRKGLLHEYKNFVDANVIISALIGGSSRDILFDHRYDFLTAEFTFEEVKNTSQR